MDLISGLGIGTTLEITLTALICFGFTQALKQTFLNNKWLPWLSAGIGIVTGIVIGFWQHDNLLTGAILGLLIGFAISGLFDGFKGFKGANNG